MKKTYACLSSPGSINTSDSNDICGSCVKVLRGNDELCVDYNASLANITIIEPETSFKKSFCSKLYSVGFSNLLKVDNYTNIAHLFYKNVIDLIILDSRICAGDISETIGHIRSDLPVGNTPILVLINGKIPTDISKIFLHKDCDYIRGSAHISEVVARISKTIENANIVRNLSEYQRRVEKELMYARQMQQKLFPSELESTIIGMKYGLSIKKYVKTSSELGGDLIGFKELDESRLGFFSLDVSGHGVGAAINTFRAQVLINDIWSPGVSPGEMLYLLNNKLAPTLETGTFMTVLCGQIDTLKNRLTYASAAHPSPILISQEQDRTVESCASEGLLLGLQCGAEYETHTVPFNRHDCFITFSDAFSETPDENGVRLGEDGVCDLVKSRACVTAEDDYFEEIIGQFQTERLKFLRDDLTLLSLRRR